jgi:hypothetical protein
MHKRIMSAVRTVEFVGDRLSCIKLRSLVQYFAVNVHAPCEDKNNDIKNSFSEDLGHIYYQLHMYNINFFFFFW